MVPDDIMEMYDSENAQEVEIEIDNDLAALDGLFYLLYKRDRYTRVRILHPILKQLEDSFDLARTEVRQKVEDDLREQLRADGAEAEDLPAIKRKLSELSRCDSPFNNSLRGGISALEYYPIFKAKSLMKLDGSKEHIRNELAQIATGATKAEEESYKTMLLLMLAKDGIYGKDAEPTIDKLYQMVPEASISKYSSKYEAVLYLYPMYRMMHKRETEEY